MRLPARRGVAGRRPERARTWSIPWARLVGAAGLVATGACLTWLTTDPTFAVAANGVPVTGARYTGSDVIRSRMGLTAGALPNIFRLDTGAMEDAVTRLPAVRAAIVTATLPDHLSVTVIERSPILVWASAGADWLVDIEGMLFAPTGTATADELGSGATGTSMPRIDDQRVTDPPLGVGDRLDPLDLAVVRLLGTLTPADVGSSADRLYLHLDPKLGYVLVAHNLWRAVFGIYTPVLRPPSEIPQQVQCLRSLLADREAAVAVITLSVSLDGCGTFRNATPRPGPTRAPGRTQGQGGGRTPTPRTPRS
jgi:hypothetical protein